jgi:hypothetical protein
MDVKVKELKGLRALRAYLIYQKLIICLGLTVFNPEKDSGTLLLKFGDYDLQKRKELLTKACSVVPLEDDEVEALTRFAVDENGIAFEKPALANLKPNEIIDLMVAVCMKLDAIECYSLNDDDELPPFSINLFEEAAKIAGSENMNLEDLINKILVLKFAEFKKNKPKESKWGKNMLFEVLGLDELDKWIHK